MRRRRAQDNLPLELHRDPSVCWPFAYALVCICAKFSQFI